MMNILLAEIYPAPEFLMLNATAMHPNFIGKTILLLLILAGTTELCSDSSDSQKQYKINKKKEEKRKEYYCLPLELQNKILNTLKIIPSSGIKPTVLDIYHVMVNRNPAVVAGLDRKNVLRAINRMRKTTETSMNPQN